VAMYVGGSWMEVGGTSVAAPIIAGVYALAGKPTTGTYPISYPYAQAAQLNDVTSGSNGSCSPAYLCAAGAGYDGPTGLGSPNGIGAFISPLLPGAPTTVTGVAGDSTVAVSWHAASGNGHPITGYAATATPGGASCSTSGTLTCSVGSLANGTSYTFRVTATNSVGTGPASAASASVVPATVPDAPAGVAATPGDSSALVSWTAPGWNGGAPVNGYTVTSSPAARTCTTTGALSCTVLGLTDGTAYTFTVTASNVIGTSVPSGPSSAVIPVTVPGATYVAVTPERLVNSRNSTGVTTLSANHHQTFSFAGSDVPSNAVAVTGNLTVTNQTAAGYISLTTSPNDAPLTSTLNFPVGDNRANGVTVPLGSLGSLNFVYVAHAGATTDVLLDVTGYFVPDATGATYVAVTPNRIVDSRSQTGVGTAVSSGNPVSFLVTNQQLESNDPTLNIPPDAIAVTGNLTVTGQTAAGYFSLTEISTAIPLTSTLNFPLGDNRANGVTVPLGTNGDLVDPEGLLWITYVGRPGATAHVVFDVTGYFVPPPG
ncbi:MAG TPA: fibronectin type III domain-containing protein, partial [Candidatus Limnocylindrales bacterium]